MLKAKDLAMKKKARHMIGNYFMRYYNQTTSDYFRRWKYHRSREVQKEALVKTTLVHWRQFQFMQVKSAFLQMAHQQKQSSCREKIRQQVL